MKCKFFFPIHILLLLLVFSSCDPGHQETEIIRINHFKQPALGEGIHLIYTVQRENEIGKEDWKLFYDNIEQFNFEWGFVYDLLIETKPVKNPMMDGSNTRHILLNVITKSQVESETEFEIPITHMHGSGFANIVTGNEETGFYLMYDIRIDCGEICSELEEQLKVDDELVGIFRHTFNDEILLTGLRTSE